LPALRYPPNCFNRNRQTHCPCRKLCRDFGDSADAREHRSDKIRHSDDSRVHLITTVCRRPLRSPSRGCIRSRLDWKYILGLDLTDPGFHHTVLSEFRTRLVAGEAVSLLLEARLTLAREQGLLKTRGRQRTDSTHVFASIRVLNRLERRGEMRRAALNTLAVVVPDWLQALAPVAWYGRCQLHGWARRPPPLRGYVRQPYGSSVPLRASQWPRHTLGVPHHQPIPQLTS
jgi:hypothetical protein